MAYFINLPSTLALLINTRPGDLRAPGITKSTRRLPVLPDRFPEATTGLLSLMA